MCLENAATIVRAKAGVHVTMTVFINGDAGGYNDRCDNRSVKKVGDNIGRYQMVTMTRETMRLKRRKNGLRPATTSKKRRKKRRKNAERGVKMSPPQ